MQPAAQQHLIDCLSFSCCPLQDCTAQPRSVDGHMMVLAVAGAVAAVLAAWLQLLLGGGELRHLLVLLSCRQLLRSSVAAGEAWLLAVQFDRPETALQSTSRLLQVPPAGPCSNGQPS